MKPMTVYDHIRSNNIRTALLVILFPLSLLVLFYGISFLFLIGQEENTLSVINQFVWEMAPFVLGAAVCWMFISYFMGDQMMLGFAGATPLSTKEAENKQIYQLVENTALAAGLPMPKVYVIQDESLNAFATGHSPKTASIALTTGIIKKLSPRELQGVVAHEMAHVGNRDVRLNLLIVTGLGIFGFLADMVWRSTFHSRSSDKDSGQLKLLLLALGVTLVVFNWIVAPLIQMAVSRTREYAADATGALITRNPAALADALEKISQDARVEILDETPTMASVCIYSPLAKKASGLGDTHPPIEERIRRLREMSGQFKSQK